MKQIPATFRVGALSIAVLAVVVSGAAPTQSPFAVGAAQAQDQTAKQDLPPYGTPDDVEYAGELWKRMTAARLTGPERITARPTKGEQPHASIQQITNANVLEAGEKQRVVVKANHRGKGINAVAVYEQPSRFLTGYAVMAKRPGYDPKNADWFWAVFNPDGSLRKFKGKAIVGRVDTGATNGCIGCHRKYGGKDFEMLTSK